MYNNIITIKIWFRLSGITESLMQQSFFIFIKNLSVPHGHCVISFKTLDWIQSVTLNNMEIDGNSFCVCACTLAKMRKELLRTHYTTSVYSLLWPFIVVKYAITHSYCTVHCLVLTHRIYQPFFSSIFFKLECNISYCIKHSTIVCKDVLCKKVSCNFLSFSRICPF